MNMPLHLFLSTSLLTPVTDSSFLCKISCNIHPARQVDSFLLPDRKSTESLSCLVCNINKTICLFLAGSPFLSFSLSLSHHAPRSENLTLQIFIASKIGRDFSPLASLPTRWPPTRLPAGRCGCTCFLIANKNTDCAQLCVILKL